MSLNAKKKNVSHQYDAVFVAEWGGMALDPYVTFPRPDDHELWLLDPFYFLARALGTEFGPVPDPATRDGLRVFYSHIDGDGFRDLSEVEAGQHSSEIIRDRILKKYPVPVTVSVIEAEIRGHLEDQKPEDEEVLKGIARSIFALPNIQAASHTYSHPFYWIDNDPTARNYDQRTISLAPKYRREGIDYHREVVGSVEYIRTLLPPGKELSIFLWSGNCRPTPEAIRYTQSLGIENMNGGDTIMSRRHPSLSGVAPRTMPWADQLQIYAANQNDNKYTDDWHGPLFGGFIHVIDTFKLTESPRRLKPVNIYYHMYSGDYHDSMKALHAAYDWAMTQPLHSLTARQFAEITRDSRFTDIFEKETNHWVIVNQGRLRTLRLPATPALPVMLESRGITGFHQHQGQLYVHTSGARRVDLRLGRPSPGFPYLITSSAEIVFQSLVPGRIDFQVEDFRPVTVRFGGMPASSLWSLKVNNQDQNVNSDAAGEVVLQLPARAQVIMSPRASS